MRLNLNNMIKLEVLKINEDKIKSALVGKIKFSDLDKIAQLTYRSDDNENFFQRNTDINRVNELAKFIKGKILDEYGVLKKQSNVLTLFPTTIILALTKNEKDDFILNDNTIEIKSGVSAYIVDGQHRFKGIQKFYEDNKLSYSDFDIELPLMLLLDYDLYEQASIFIEVNFKQKAVNRSFYYDIFGSLPAKRSELQLAHYLVKYLNETEKSPFYNLVKMLGTGDGTISQAFLVENIFKLFRPKSIFSTFYFDYEKGGDQQKEIAKILLSYFNIIKETFHEYTPQKNENGNYSVFGQDILFKTTGIGALIKLLNDFTSDVIKIHNDEEKLEKYFKYIFSLINKLEAKSMFSKDGDYAKGGGGGLQSKLHQKLREIIEYKKNIVGKRYQNAEILDVQKSKDDHNRDIYDLSFNNGTTTRINNEILEQIRNL